MAEAVMEPLAGAETVPPPETPVAPVVSIAASVEPGRLQRIGAATGIPRTALAVYAGAASVLAEQSRVVTSAGTLSRQSVTSSRTTAAMAVPV